MSATFKRLSAYLAIIVFSSIAIQEARASLTCSQLFAESRASEAPLDPHLVKDVVDLPDHKEIPQSIYESFPVNEIARAIVQRVRSHEIMFQRKIESTEPKKIDVFKETDIILFFWETNIESIAANGFLNLHESHSSEALYNPSKRLRAEDLFTGVQLGLSPQALKLRPKSAFLNIRPNIDLVRKEHTIIDQYGNIGAVFKPEVKHRSLWVDSDSLWISQTSLVMNSRTLIPYRGTFYRDSISCVSLCKNYYEALIYGKIGFDDVDYFLVTDPSLVNRLKPFGRPVYQLIKVFKNNRVIFEKGELLFAGRSDAEAS